ncbi:MAG TPA: Rne/Rng family ribonuclease [Propionibacteriaceae bacterium]|nr:Rne/Rng family ribonuclease [Propionibacteriaceae bacterium]
MLDPHEPDVPTSETNEQPPAQPTPRRRRAASRPAGPPSSAPDAPSIESAGDAPEPVSELSTGAEGAPPTEQAAKKSTRKRTTKKHNEETPPGAGEVVKTPRKRTLKKAVAMATEAASEVAATPSAEPEEVAPAPDQELPVADIVADAAPEEKLEAPVAVGPVAEEPSAEEPALEQSAPEQEGLAQAAGETATDGETGEGRRRRRRRGGRRRRRTSDDEAVSTEAEQAEEDEAAEISETTEGTTEGQRRRRRRRRRKGEESAPAPDDPTETVTRVREPRRQEADSEVSGIDGSTRMEAKRQRRREGREAGRRRAPVLSEAEFLARRESVVRKMIIRQLDDLVQIAVLEDDILVEHYVDRATYASLIGNVYLGRVQNVLPSMEAAFVDIGRGRNGVIYAGEIDWDYFGAEGQNRKVEKVLKPGQTILVQVSKDPVGAKGARLTNHVSIPGRYIVYSPGGQLSGISRKLPEIERRRLKEILSDLVGESASVIVRTAAEGASEEELVRDVNRLKAQWEDIEKKVAAGNAPQVLYAEPDLTVRIVRDLFTEDFSELIISGNGGITDAYDSVEAYVSHVAPHLKDRLRHWEGDTGLFAEYRLDEQIAKGLERKVFLPSGGSLIIDRTEAMTVIDVNTGKFTGTGGNLEATVTSNNLEAAEEIVRQLRLRDIGGIIVIDFIDMVLPSNRELLLRRLVECLGRDRTRHQVAEITSLGLVQMTRKRIGTGLLEAFSTECPQCHGRGYELHDMPVESHRHADGGARDSRPRDRRGNAQASSRKPADSAQLSDAAEDSNEGAPEDRPPRGQRSRRGRRSAAAQEQDGAEPQAEPVVLS